MLGDSSGGAGRGAENNQDGDKTPICTLLSRITISLPACLPTPPSAVEPPSAAVLTPPSAPVASSSGNSQSHPSRDQEFVQLGTVDFTPYALILEPGEDLIAGILHFSEGRSDVQVLSASGLVTTIVPNGSVAHMADFEILNLFGSGPGNFYVALRGPDGREICCRAHSLVAASRVQIIIGSFTIPRNV